MYFNPEVHSVKNQYSSKSRKIISVHSKKTTLTLVESSSRMKCKKTKPTPLVLENNAVS